ncbi:MAG: neutral zinc metallopeptidase [Propionibacteriaceae bacterium]|nr:neutral zinc metallopeptidase [Propionibacteriaceae bacterium]
MVAVLLIVGPTIVGSGANFIKTSNNEPPVATPTSVASSQPRPSAAPPTYAGESTGPRFSQWPENPYPPELVYPETESDLDFYLNSNSLYDQTLAPTACSVGTVDLATASFDELDRYMTDLVACLMDAWDDPVYAAGYELPRPSVTIYSEGFTTKCGQAPAYNAFYCGADQQLYYSYDLVQLFSPDLREARFMTEAIMAHEFGHTVQGRTGILTSEAYYQEEAATPEDEALWSRRTELQADCFSGLFLNSISQGSGLTAQDQANISQMFAQLGDPPLGGDHGRSASRQYWFHVGISNNWIGACQTFTVPADQVS